MTDKLLKLEEFTRYNNALKGKIRWFGTRAEYDAIATKDPNTLYLITDEGKIYRNGVLFGGQPMDADWSDTSINGLQNLKITSGITHCYGDGDSGLPGTMKRIRSGDTLPSGGTEGDIFFKHRGTNADYLISTDIINDLTTGGTDKVLSAEQGKLLQTNKVNVSDIINDLTTGGTDKVLSAEQGKLLQTNKVNVSDIINAVTSTATNKPLSANMGKYIYDTFNNSQQVSLVLTPDSGWTTSNAYAHKVGPNCYLVRFRAQYNASFSTSVKFASSSGDIKVNGFTPSKGQVMNVACHSSRVLTNLVHNSSGNWWFNKPTGATTSGEDLYCEGILYAY